MDQLLTWIYSRFLSAAGATTRAVLVGGLTTAEEASPETDAENAGGTGYPHGILMVPSTATDDNLDADHIQVTIQFSVYTENTSPLEALQGLELLRQLYKDQTATLTDWKIILMQVEQFGRITYDPDDGSASAHMDIRCRIGSN